MPGIQGPPTVIKPPDLADSEGSSWWVYALVALFLVSGLACLLIAIIAVL